MKYKLAGFLILFFIVLLGCDATKESQQRRNLMIPKKSDLPKNQKYTPSKKKKTYKSKKKKKRYSYYSALNQMYYFNS